MAEIVFEKTLSGKVIRFLKRNLNPFNTENNYRNLAKNAKNQTVRDLFNDTSSNYRNMGKKKR